MAPYRVPALSVVRHPPPPSPPLVLPHSQIPRCLVFLLLLLLTRPPLSPLLHLLLLLLFLLLFLFLTVYFTSFSMALPSRGRYYRPGLFYTLCIFIRFSRSAKTLTVAAAAAVSFIVPAFGNVATRRRTNEEAEGKKTHDSASR